MKKKISLGLIVLTISLLFCGIEVYSKEVNDNSQTVWVIAE